MTLPAVIADAAHTGAYAERGTIDGHPATPLYGPDGNVATLVTCCAECGALSSIIMLVGNRWYCSRCRVEGRVDRNVTMIPISR